jgi:hypothetical protein
VLFHAKHLLGLLLDELTKMLLRFVVSLFLSCPLLAKVTMYWEMLSSSMVGSNTSLTCWVERK